MSKLTSTREISLEPSTTLEGISLSWANVFIALINGECPLPAEEAQALNVLLLKMHALMLKNDSSERGVP